jgi:hypothetical protein
MNSVSTGTEKREGFLQSANKKTSSRSMAVGIIGFSFLAGLKADSGVEHLIHFKAGYDWIVDFGFALVFLGIAIRWVIPLLSRARTSHGS